MWFTVALCALLPSVFAVANNQSAFTAPGTPSAFTAPGAFPTSMFTKYYNDPKQTASQVQPIIKDPVETVRVVRV